MNTEQQRIAIAQACGWTEIEPCTCFDGISRGYQPTAGAHKKHLPDYLNDLNAMHEAEKVLVRLQWVSYLRKLQTLCEESFTWHIHATASQRAEAFLRTIGKWNECGVEEVGK